MFAPVIVCLPIDCVCTFNMDKVSYIAKSFNIFSDILYRLNWRCSNLSPFSWTHVISPVSLLQMNLTQSKLMISTNCHRHWHKRKKSYCFDMFHHSCRDAQTSTYTDVYLGLVQITFWNLNYLANTLGITSDNLIWRCTLLKGAYYRLAKCINTLIRIDEKNA